MEKDGGLKNCLENSFVSPDLKAQTPVIAQLTVNVLALIIVPFRENRKSPTNAKTPFPSI